MISFFIPIRKGSKRIINKNFRPLPGFKNGLTEIKIKQLLNLKKIIKKKKIIKNIEFVVSTNCEKTIKFVQNFKWIKIHLRSDKEAGDDSLNELIKIVPKICSKKYILWTHVTSPFFNHYDYLKFILEFLKNKKKSAFSADLIKKFLYSTKRGWISHNAVKKKWPRTQDLEPIYIANSCAFIAHRNTYIKNNDRLCNNPLPVETRKKSNLDIDDYNDLLELKNKLKKIRI